MDENTLINYLQSDEFKRAASNSTRLVGKLVSAVQRRELYETHQILRTVYFRFVNSTEKISALSSLLYYGSYYLLQNDEFISGQDIASLFLECSARLISAYRQDAENRVQATINLSNPSLTYHIGHETLDYKICYRVAAIVVQLPDTEIGQSKFTAEVLSVLSRDLLNRDLLHHVIAHEFSKRRDFVNSRYHYLHCASLENAENIAQLLIDYHTESATKSEVDLFITQFILQFLCLHYPDETQKRNLKSMNPAATPKPRNIIKLIAMAILTTYTKRHPLLGQSCIPYSSMPLLNFTYFITALIDGQNEPDVYKMLCEIYKLTWNRDPNYSSYLNRIGTHYFGIIEQPKQRPGGFLNNILMSLLEDADDDDDSNNNFERNTLSSCDELD